MGIAGGCDDLRAEVAELRRLVTRGQVEPADVTPFHGWRVRDTIEHLVTIDRLAALTLSAAPEAAAELAAFGAGIAPPDADAPRAGSFARIAAYETARLGLLSWAQLLAAWEVGLDELCTAARACGEEAKVAWFGSAMRVPALLSARHMEVWAYGQDVFDRYRIERAEGERLRTVVEFGLRTFGFSFANRREPMPPVKPFVALTSPGGARWEWNDPAAPDRVAGSAVEFCRVVTQRRHIADTALEATGPTAARWMRIAQCIAGPPLDGPEPGSRG